MVNMLKNKKGMMGADSFVFGFIGFFVFLLVLICLIPVQEGDMVAERSMESLRIAQNSTMGAFHTSENNTVIVNVVYSLITFVSYCTFEVTKLALEYGFSHPEVINAKVLLWLMIVSLVIPIVFYLIKIVAVLFILIKEIFQSHVEKRRLKKLQQIKDNTKNVKGGI